MKVEFIFDTVCPWCYVGKRRFEAALAQRPGLRVDIHWRPFLLNPDLPMEGIDRQAYLDRKFGGPSRVNRVHNAVTSAAESVGLTFAFDKITRAPNTLNSHRMIRFSTSLARDVEVVEALYKSYFCDGRDIGSVDELVSIGAQAGLPADKLRDYLLSDADIAVVMNDNNRAHRLGVNGVPCLILDGQYAIAGAQEPDVLLRLIDIARETEAEPALS